MSSCVIQDFKRTVWNVHVVANCRLFCQLDHIDMLGILRRHLSFHCRLGTNNAFLEVLIV